MASLFISYSRLDIDFAYRLTGSLNAQKMDFWIDWEGIPPTVDWWKEIERGIEEADIFLFLLSPDSAKSKVCKQEIEHAVRNGKRLIPIVVRDVKSDEAPPELRPLNWIFFREKDDFGEAFDKLMTAINTDYGWAQAHRQLQVKALEWDRNNKENSYLLRGKELKDAESQISINISKEPYPTTLQREYVSTSRTAKTRQQRLAVGITAVLLIIVVWLAYDPVTSWLSITEMPDWTLIDFHTGDSPRLVTMNLQNPDEVYASGQTSGDLYRSNNGGKTWSRIKNPETGNSVIGLTAVDNLVYALTSDSVWVTQNGVESWDFMENPLFNTTSQLLSISINPQNGTEIYVGSNDGIIYHASDIGANWNIVPAGYKGRFINSIATNGFVIIVATEEGLWGNVTGSDQWHEISLQECSDRTDNITVLAFATPYGQPPPDGSYGFFAAIPDTGICDADTKNLYDSIPLRLSNYSDKNLSAMVFTGEADLGYEGYITADNNILQKRIWSFHDFEWWKIKFNSLFSKGERNE